LGAGEKILSDAIPQYDTGKRLWMYFGASRIKVKAPSDFRQKQIRELVNAFPKYRTFRATIGISTDYPTTEPVLTIPYVCRASALYEDLDYSAPVWLSLLALCIFGYSLWTKPQVKAVKTDEPSEYVGFDTVVPI
jgi:hypothetical protein